MVSLHTEDEMRRHIRDALGSREWWLIPWFSEESGFLSETVERGGYAGEASADFQILLLSKTTAGIFALSLAKKARLDAEHLAALLIAQGVPISVDKLREQDVLCAAPADPVDSLIAMGAMLLFNRWLVGQAPAEASS